MNHHPLTFLLLLASLATNASERRADHATRPPCSTLENDDVASAWRAARGTLELLSAGLADTTGGYIVSSYRQRRISPHYSVREHSARTDTLAVLQTLRTAPVEVIAHEGLLREERGRWTYAAPMPEVLLSSWFANTHCFELARGGYGVALRFRPKQKPVGRADVQGALWLDAALRTLRKVEFEFVGAPARASVPAGKGAYDVAQVGDRLVLSSWQMSLQVREPAPRRGVPLVAITETGGRVLDVLTPNSPVLASMPRGPASRDRDLQMRALELHDALLQRTDRDALESEMADVTASDPAERALQRGTTALRLAELGVDAAEQEARAAFVELARLTKQPAWTHYAQALLDVQEWEHKQAIGFIQALKSAVGHGPLDAAREQLRSALRADSTFSPALVTFGQLAKKEYSRAAVLEALDAIERAGNTLHPGVAGLAIELDMARDSAADVSRWLARVPAALRAAPELAYARAILAFRTGQAEAGYPLYAEAVQSSSATVRAEAQADVAALFEDGDTIPAGAQLLEFWRSRAALAGISVAERLQQHFSRLNEARARYLRRSKFSPQTMEGAIRHGMLSASGELDARGVVYVRRGPPTQKVLTPIDSINNESWVYLSSDGGTEVFHFMQSYTPPDWVLTDGLLGCTHEDYLRDRTQYDSRIARMLVMCHSSYDATRAVTMAAEARTETRGALARVPAVTHKKELPFYFSTQTLRSMRSEQPLELVVIAIPGEQLQPRTVADGVAYAFRVTVSMADSVARRTTQKDTTVALRSPTSFAKGSLVRVIVELPTFAGRKVEHRVHVTDLNNPAAGQVYAGARDIDAFPAGALGMSDILFTRSISARSGWTRGDLTLDVVPVQQFRGAFGMFFELYNAQPGATYKIDMAVGEKSGGIFHKKKSLSLSYSEAIPAGDASRVPIFKQLQLELGPGKYVVQVTVTDPTGRKVTNERTLTVIP